MSREHFEKLERIYVAAPVNKLLHPKIVVSEGQAEISMAVQEDFHHAAGAVHGSYYFKMLDDACFFAANSLARDEFFYTASFNVQLMRAVSAGALKAVGRVIREGRNMIFTEGTLEDDTGKEIARGSGLFARSGVKLADVGES